MDPKPQLDINWEITYACQLRCSHCYTESGRRAARKIPRKQLLQVTEALIAGGVCSVQFGGGEPLLVPEIFEIAERLQEAGIDRHLFTNGIGITAANALQIARVFPKIHVSIDGPTAAIHDPIRGRAGSFDACMAALQAFDDVAAARQPKDDKFIFGVDVVVMQRNLEHLETFCTAVAPAFPNLRFLIFSAAVPAGMATSESFAETELLTDDQLANFRDPAFAARLRAAAPHTVHVEVMDNFALQLSPELVKKGLAATETLMLEPDGGVRGLILHEGIVGNLLEEPLDVIWERAHARLDDPFVVEQLSNATSMKQWALASRNLDRHFAKPEDQARIAKRGQHVIQPHRKLPMLRTPPHRP